jgi:hypothetical protein
MNGPVRIYRRTDLPESTREFIARLTLAEFGHLPVITGTAWSPPDWHVFFLDGENILSFVSIVERTALFDECAMKVSGISNMITIESHRRKGLGTLVMQRAQEFIAYNLRADLGLLLCSDDVMPFYSRLKWTSTGARLRFDQPSGKREWEKDVMLYFPHGRLADYKTIDLNGLPW